MSTQKRNLQGKRCRAHPAACHQVDSSCTQDGPAGHPPTSWGWRPCSGSSTLRGRRPCSSSSSSRRARCRWVGELGAARPTAWRAAQRPAGRRAASCCWPTVTCWWASRGDGAARRRSPAPGSRAAGSWAGPAGAACCGSWGWTSALAASGGARVVVVVVAAAAGQSLCGTSSTWTGSGSAGWRWPGSAAACCTWAASGATFAGATAAAAVAAVAAAESCRPAATAAACCSCRAENWRSRGPWDWVCKLLRFRVKSCA